MTNNLSYESSPYLLEHADNPVNWFAWNDKAFEIAKEQKKIIFVSIGYSACHWCHVMRHESFENEEVARLLNENFVSIKVDREERPDIDHLLQMTFQIMNGRSGGWPLSIFMTSDKKPFYSGTYFPLKSKYGMPGFIEVLQAVIKSYSNKFPDITLQAQKIESYIKEIQIPKESNSITDVSSLEIIESFAESIDSVNGGFIGAPKFPMETALYLLLHESALINNQTGLKMVFKTLDSMLNGGIYDQLGGGFHRYSVDEAWLIPHFEKMLYNQSLMVFVLLEAFRVSKNEFYQEKSKEILEYDARDMKSKKHGFYSSQNADSEGDEGKYYVWTKNELNFLAKDESEVFCGFYDITQKGNWESKNILNIVTNLEDLSNKYNKSINEIKTILSEAKKKILENRNKRVAPSIDTKMITSWNALMTKAYILAYRVFTDDNDKEFALNIARQGINYIIDMIQGDIIYRVFVDDKKTIKGFLDDYQYSISALLDFYEITLEEQYYSYANKLFLYSLSNFYDSQDGSFFYSMKEHNTLITRFKNSFDSPLPSPIAYAIHNTLKFSFYDEKSSDYYHTIITKSFSNIRFNPNVDFSGIASITHVKHLFLNNFTEITITYSSKNNQLLKIINQLWIPFRLQIDVNTESFKQEILEKEYLKGKITKQREIQVFICKNFVCSLPLENYESIKSYLLQIFPKMKL